MTWVPSLSTGNLIGYFTETVRVSPFATNDLQSYFKNVAPAIGGFVTILVTHFIQTTHLSLGVVAVCYNIIG